MLYFAAGFITTAALLLGAVVIPYVATDTYPRATPENAIRAIAVNITVHLFVLVAVIWTISVQKRKGKFNNELLVACGIIPIILGLMVLDGAFAYLDHPGMLVASISMFLCVGFDVTGGVLVLIARYSRKSKP